MLYAVARKFGKQALAVFTVSDNALTGAGLDSSERERGFNDMITLALDTAVRAVITETNTNCTPTDAPKKATKELN